MTYAVGFLVLGLAAVGCALRLEANGRWWLQWLTLSGVPLMLVPARALVTRDLTTRDVVWVMGVAIWTVLVAGQGRPSRLLPAALLPPADDREIAYREHFQKRGAALLVAVGVAAMFGAVVYVFGLDP